MSDYEAPAITELGSIAEFTQGEGWKGNHDSKTFQWGRFNFTVNYGTS